MKKIYLQLVFLTLFTSATFAQVYVTSNGAGSKDGTSWTNAYDGTQLQTAINAASSGTQVWVAKGTYKPTESLSTTGFLTDGITAVTARDNTFILKTGVEIYGGFAGGETFGVAAIAGRNLVLNETILSGDLNNSNVADDGDYYHIVSSRNASLGAILDGFTLQHGFANGAASITEGGSEIVQNRGAAINLFGDLTGATLKNLIVRNNEATSFAGGIYARGADGFSFTNILVENNTSGSTGGGLYIWLNTATSTTVNNCTFNTNKSANDGGGGLYFSGDANSVLNVNNSMFSGNETTLYGGALRLNTGTGNVIGTTFKDGRTTAASSRGGAIYHTNGSNLNITGCIFKNNTSVSGGHYYAYSGIGVVKNSTFENGIATSVGGGVFNFTAELTISKSNFYGNTSEASGGALYINSGASVSTNTVVSNSFFYNNLAKSSSATGGGAAIFQINGTAIATATIINNTFYGNKSVSINGAYGFNNAASNKINLYNNIFYGNLASYDLILGTGSLVGAADIRRSTTAVQVLSNNLFQTDITTSGSRTVTNAYVLAMVPEPLFASTTPMDFNFLYPTSDSFAKEKGNNALYASAGDFNTDTHLAGYARLEGANLDLGAIEYAVILPVTISSFNAKLANNRTQLNWTVGTEDNVNRYEVERSQNGVDFSKVATVTANSTNSYSTVDAAPQNGVNYYRLKTVDNDGKYSYYGSIQTVKVNSLSIEGVKVYPNPVIGIKVSVSMGGSAAGTYQYKLVNTAGVFAQKGTVNYDGAKDISFTTTVPSGLYLLHLENGSVKVTTKLIRQ